MKGLLCSEGYMDKVEAGYFVVNDTLTTEANCFAVKDILKEWNQPVCCEGHIESLIAKTGFFAVIGYILCSEGQTEQLDASYLAVKGSLTQWKPATLLEKTLTDG